MLQFHQSNGELTNGGTHVDFGYSGRGEGKNNPAMEGVHNLGVIPRGAYRIGPAQNPVTHLGPLAFPLTPVGHDALGRTAFFIHGANAAHPLDSSDGCPIFKHETREWLVSQVGELLQVV